MTCFITSARAEICAKVGLSVVRSICEQNYSKSNQLISLKLDVMIEPIIGRTV